MTLIEKEKLQQILDEAVASGEECGCQLAVYQHGKLLCTLCAGFTTPDKKIKVDGISTTYKFEDIKQAIEDTISKKIYKAYIEL